MALLFVKAHSVGEIPLRMAKVSFSFACHLTEIKFVCVDFLLGDSFLRNVYSLYDFGNWTTAGTDGPFMQILSVSLILPQRVAFNSSP